MRAVLNTILTNTAVALVLTLFFYAQVADRAGWAALGRYFVINMVIAHSIGSLCEAVLTRGLPLFWNVPGWRWPILTGLLLALALAGCVVAVAILGPAVSFRRGYSFWRAVADLYPAAAVITLVVGITAVVIGTYRHKAEESAALLRLKDLETSAARLASLESRIQPHFLFNALNSISSLIREDPARAERLVEQLSSLLRSSLDTQESGVVPLGRELNLVADYLEIQKARFEGRLRYAIDAPADLLTAGVPPFAVQTLVENSVKHAVSARSEGGAIQVAARVPAQGLIEVVVTDDGPGVPASVAEAPPKGHGLDNLRSRLVALFGDRASLEIAGNRVALTVPAGT